MDARQASFGASEEPLIDLRPVDAAPSSPSSYVPETPPFSPGSPPRSSSPRFTPGRSVRELVESLGSPVNSSPTSPRVSATPPLRLPSPSPFFDPFEDKKSNNSRTFGTTSFIPFKQEDSSPGDFTPCLFDEDTKTAGIDFLGGREIESTLVAPCPAPASFQPDAELPSTSFTRPPLPASLYRPVLPSWLPRASSPRPASPIPYATRFARPSSYNPSRPYIRRTHTPTVPPVPAPAHPWNRPTTDQESFTRPDRFSRTTAHTTISDILFNFDLDPAEAAELIDDACQTARQVGVSTHDLLSRSVFLGTTDLGMTPLCLEASRVDVENGLELVLWLVENTRPGDVYNEVRNGCLLRRNGMGEQAVWNVLRGFVSEFEGGPTVAYDVEVEPLGVVPHGQVDIVEDSDDEGSLYDDMSIIDVESGMTFIDQADIETLKSSDDELDKDEEKEQKQEQEQEPQPRVPPRVHRARIVLPTFKDSLTGPSWAYTSPSRTNRFGMAASGGIGDKLITAEWIFEGRVWALSIGEDSIVLTLRQASSAVSSDPVHVQATIRLIPLDLLWTGVAEIDHIGPDGLLPTQTPSDTLLSSPLYECELEKDLVPGPVRVDMNSSVGKTEIRASLFTLLELVGDDSGVKVEVVLRVGEIEVPSVCASVADETGSTIADDTSEWQIIDD